MTFAREDLYLRTTRARYHLRNISSLGPKHTIETRVADAMLHAGLTSDVLGKRYSAIKQSLTAWALQRLKELNRRHTRRMNGSRR